MHRLLTLCARADARTAFQDSLFVKMVRSDDDDDDDGPARGFTFRLIFFRFVSIARARGWMSIEAKDRPRNFGCRDWIPRAWCWVVDDPIDVDFGRLTTPATGSGLETTGVAMVDDSPRRNPARGRRTRDREA